MPEPMRTCIHCGQTKPIHQFAKTNKYYREDGTTINWRKHTRVYDQITGERG